MMNISIYFEAFLPFMVRFILGSLFLFQAYDKLFRIGMDSTFNSIYPSYSTHNFPKWFMKLSIWCSTYIELIGGAFLILGLFKPLTILFLGINMMMVTLGFSFLKGMWDMEHVFPRLILLLIISVMPFGWDTWSLDYLLSIELQGVLISTCGMN
jgi:uncharacterized membrane protein YphA (DoxX/SURF4 family)